MAVIAIELTSRVFAFLALGAALGSPWAMLLPVRIPLISRLALAPALGLAAGTCTSMSLAWFLPANRTPWFIPVLAAISCLIAYFIARKPGRGHASLPTRVEVAQYAVVIFLAIVPTMLVFVSRDSVGPVGYQVGDAQGYVADIDGNQLQSIRDASKEGTSAQPGSDLEHYYWTTYVAGFQELDAQPFIAEVDTSLGLWGTDTESPFLIAVLAAFALGAFAATRHVLARPTWLAVGAAAAVVGPLSLQLLFDGSEAALLGLSVLIPIVMLIGDLLDHASLGTSFAMAILTSGLIAYYPLFLPDIVVIVIAALVMLGLRKRRNASGEGLLASRGGACLVAAVIAGICLNPYATVRATRYFAALFRSRAGSVGPFPIANFPQYTFLNPPKAAAWLTQSIPFYDLQRRFNPVVVILACLIIPVLAIVALAVGVRFSAVARLCASGVAVSVGLGFYQYVVRKCSYCADRALLPSQPLIIFAVTIGIGELVALRVNWRRMVALTGVAALAVITVNGWLSLTRFGRGAYFLDTNVRAVMARLPEKGTVELEGFNENHDSFIEQMLVYEFAEEHAHGRVSLTADTNDSSALIYMGLRHPLTGAQFDPHYRWVLTRMPAIATGRKILTSRGGIALEERVQSGDVLADSGFLVAPETNQEGGYAYVDSYVDEPLRLVVNGTSNNPHVRITIKGLNPAVRVSGATVIRRTGRDLVACAPTVKDGPSSVAEIRFRPSNNLQVIGLFASSSCASRS